jgi:hypothetical protein
MRACSGVAYERCPAYALPETLTLSDFIMTSPLFPKNYPAGKDCGWIIQPNADPAQRILFSFEFVDLVAPHYLELYPVKGTSERYGEQVAPFDVLVDNNSARIRLSTMGASSTTGKGYSFSYHGKNLHIRSRLHCMHVHIHYK